MAVPSPRSRPIVVTGPTGWIGQAFLASLAAAGGDWSRDIRLFGSSERDVQVPDGTYLPMRALDTIASADVEGADVVHLAYLTKEKVGQLGKRRFFDINTGIDDALQQALEGGRPHAVFVASSGAAALAERGEDRHLYGVTKLLQEDRFLAYGRRTGVPVVAGRIYNIAGPYINKLSSYAISDFIEQARDTGRIRIQAAVPVFRSYLHVDDLARLVTELLGRSISAARPVDFCGGEVVEMMDIARAVAAIAGVDEAAISRPPVDYDRFSAYLGSPVQMRSLAQRCDIRLQPFEKQVADTAEFTGR